jgi:hypothetical protein
MGFMKVLRMTTAALFGLIPSAHRAGPGNEPLVSSSHSGGVLSVWVDTLVNVYPHLNQAYMAGLMAAPMVIIELALMAPCIGTSGGTLASLRSAGTEALRESPFILDGAPDEPFGSVS